MNSLTQALGKDIGQIGLKAISELGGTKAKEGGLCWIVLRQGSFSTRDPRNRHRGRALRRFSTLRMS